MNYDIENELHGNVEKEMTYGDQRYYNSTIKLDRSLYPKGTKIPVVTIVNHSLHRRLAAKARR